MPAIFNVVVDAVVRHWESLVEEGGGGDNRDNSSGNEVSHTVRRTIRERDDGQQWTYVGHKRLKVQAAFLYADNGVLAYTNLVLIQTEFYILTGLFYWLGLKMNVKNTVGMVYHPCHAVGLLADEAYTWRMTGVGQDYKDIQRERVR